MSTNTTVPIKPTSISAMQLRRRSGKLLNNVYYRRQRFIIERAGEPVAVVMPLADYQKMVTREQAANKQLQAMTQEMREKFASLSKQEIDALVDEAVTVVRAHNTEKGS